MTDRKMKSGTMMPFARPVVMRWMHAVSGGWVILGLAAAVLFLAVPQTASRGVRAGLALCAHAVIPSVFPFLVLSPIAAAVIRRMLVHICGGDVRAAGLWSAFIPGMLSGFPVGAVTLQTLCRGGILTRAEAARFLGVCSGASPAFLTAYFGLQLYGNVRVGWAVWSMQCVLCLAGFLWLLRRCSDRHAGAADIEVPVPSLQTCLHSAASSMLGICASVVFFTVLRAFICTRFSGGMAAILCGICEMTGGLGECMALADAGMLSRPAALILSCGMIGFGGGCIGMQVSDAAAQAKLPMRYYWYTRILLAAGLMAAAAVFSMGGGM